MERVIVFIDGANLFFSALDLGIAPNFDFEKLIKKLVGTDRKLVRVYYYDAPINQKDDPERYKKQQRFFYAINRLKYFEVKKGRMLAGKQKGVDVRIATDMVAFGLKDTYDTAILVSADSDLISAIEYVKAEGKQVELAFFDKCWDLKNNCDVFIELNKNYFKGCY